MLELLIGLAIYIACYIYTCGTAFAHFQRGFSSIRKGFFKQDRVFSVLISLGGPISALIAYFGSGFNEQGWLWPWSAKAKKEAGVE